MGTIIHLPDELIWRFAIINDTIMTEADFTNCKCFSFGKPAGGMGRLPVGRDTCWLDGMPYSGRGRLPMDVVTKWVQVFVKVGGLDWV